MSISVKAFVGSGSEIRRFQIPVDVSTNYNYLRSKICDVFPTLGGGNFQLYWRDGDGDEVRFSSDDELMMAVASRIDDTFRVYIKVVGEENYNNQKPNAETNQQTDGQSEGPTHAGVVCDVCDKNIHGTRFKCCECADFDLCSGCEATGVHSEHMMVRMVKPMEYGQGGFHGFAGAGFMPFSGPCFPPFGFHGRGHPYWRGGNRGQRSGCRGRPSGCRAGPKAKSDEPQPSTSADSEAQSSGVQNECGGDQQSGNGCGGPGAEQGAEFLKNLGEGLSNILGAMGVDVHYDIEHGGPRQCPQGRCPTDSQSTPSQTEPTAPPTDENMDTSSKQTSTENGDKPDDSQSSASSATPDSRNEVMEAVRQALDLFASMGFSVDTKKQK